MKVVGTLTRESDGADAFVTGKSYLLAADQTRTSSAWATIADVNGNWTVPVVAGKNYRIQVVANWESSSTTVGMGIRPNLSDGAAGTMVGTSLSNYSTAASAFMGSHEASNDSYVYSNVGAANSAYPWTFDIVFSCTVSGNFNMQMASETTGATTRILAGSMFKWEEI